MPRLIPPDKFVIIIGAMKAGTSSLFSMLASHPGICGCVRKEPEYFSATLGPEVSASRYENLFDFDDRRHQWCLEASTGYTKFPDEIDVPRRMKTYGIEPRFIYAVRNPADRVESHYNFAHLNDRPWAREEILDIHAVQISMYHMQLREYLAFFPDPDRYRIVDFDDIVKRPMELATDLFEWLDLDTSATVSTTPENVTPTPSNIERRMKRSGVQWTRFIPDRARVGLKTLLRKFDRSAKRRLTPGERLLIHQWLEYDMARFADTFGFPVDKWGFDKDVEKPA